MGQRERGESASRDGAVVSRARHVDAHPLAALRALDGPHAVWDPPADDTVVGAGVAATVTGDGEGRIASVRDAGTELLSTVDAPDEPAARPRLVGGVSFHAGHAPTPPWPGFPGTRFVLPRVQVTGTEGGSWVTLSLRDADPERVESELDDVVTRLDGATPPSPGTPPGVVGTTATPSRSEWQRSVEAATDRIRGGDLRKVVLARMLETSLDDPVDVPALLARLGSTYGDCYLFSLDGAADAVFLGATPERLVAWSGDGVETEALAGSVGRGADAVEDDRLAAQLRSGDRYRREHDIVVESIRDQLAPHVSSLSTGETTVRKLATVQHLSTPVTARLAEDAHVLDLVAALHPTPAVGGLPPDAALETIRETEPFERGWYAAPVGWFDADGHGEFAVGIRSAVVQGQRATLFAGNGLVADSDPTEEWAEVQLKYRPILDHLER